ncbi:MAG: acylneuraminate cytidylyltransferase family protein [Promethearchaeota archaeon]|jgi:CMP-N-acetylneuraminic acid synthetase
MLDSNSTQKILAIIPARGGSKRIRNKNLVDLCNKPLISYSILAAKSSKYIDRTIVSTDEESIAEVSETYGAEVLKRPRNLALDDTPTIDVVLHALSALNEKNYTPSLIVLLQPTSPLRTTNDIDNAITLFLNGNSETLISVCESEHSPFWSLKIKDGYLEPIFGKKYFNKRSQDLEKVFRPNGAIYITKPEIINKYKSFYTENIVSFIMPSERSIDIDDEIDLMLAELILKKFTT